MNYFNSKLLILSLFLSSCGNLKIKNKQPEQKEKRVTFIRPVKILHDYNEPVRRNSVVKVKKNKTSSFIEKPKKKLLSINRKKSGEKKLKLKFNNYTTPPKKAFVSEENIKKEMKLKYPMRIYNHWMKYFRGKNKERFMRQLVRGSRYFSLIRDVFNRHNLPEDLYYVGLIESGFHLSARSKANAVGPWQFIKGTAKMHGLKVNSYVDERKSIFKATEAAARYFKDLYNIFGSWELALCAYNAGEFRVINAIRRGNSRSYKELVKKKLLPKETIYYVPKFAAAKELGSLFYKTKRGKKLVGKGRKDLENVGKVYFKRSFSLFDFVKNTKASIKSLRKYNPDLRRSRIRVDSRRPFAFYLDSGTFEASLSYFKRFTTPSFKRTHKKDVASRKRIRVKVVYEKYKVKSGDNLLKIAKRYRVRLSSLKAWNRLKRSRIFKGQVLKVKKLKQYTVREGDNLTIIARKLKTSVRKIVRFNSLKTKKIFPRQKIHIPI